MKKLFALFALLALSVVYAAEHKIQMLNKGADGAMVFEPAYVNAKPGDTITFVATDPTHNAQSVLVPDGAEAFKTPGALMAKGTTASFTLSKEGVYVYECKPHTAMGMVGIIQVGKATNIAKVNADIFKPAKAKERLTKYIAQIKK